MKEHMIRTAEAVVFGLYLVLLFYVLFFAEGYGRAAVGELRYNLVPFAEISRFLTYHRQIGILPVLLNIGGNILGFMPLGFELPALIPFFRKGIRAVAGGALLSSMVEVIQLVARVGSYDVDDILLNTLGTLLGYLVYRSISGYRRRLDG